MVKTVVVVTHDPAWSELFAEEHRTLSEVFDGAGASIEHVGSTSVRGLAAKPVIDIIVGVPALTDVEARIGELGEHGYHYVPEYERELPDRRYFRRPGEAPSTHHLHCVVEGGEMWRRNMAFRDYLRAHAETAREYGELKKRLALAHRTDRPAYQAAKGPFIERILREAGVT